MLSESSFIVNHWITILWLVAAGLYTSFAIIADLYHAKAPTEGTDND
jgi:divalent metal cation (Fe/Co/Zn/Cd) transporter